MYVRTNIFISNKDRASLEQVNFYLKRATPVILTTDIDENKVAEISILPMKAGFSFDLRVTVQIIDKLNEYNIVIHSYKESLSTYLRIYILRDKDITYYINLLPLEGEEPLLNNLNKLYYYNSANANLEKDVDYMSFILKNYNLSTDLDLMLFACLVLRNYDKFGEYLLEDIKEKLAYYGYNEDEITENVDIITAKDYKENCLNYLMRKLYDFYDNIDKDTYLKEMEDIFDDECFARYIRMLIK